MTQPPVLSAMMCDGLGWFDDLDYKRMLLAFDEILYLLPRHIAGYRDERGELRAVVFPKWLSESAAVTVHHFVPDDNQRELIHAAAAADLGSEGFQASVNAIPERERTYTWKIACADGDLTEDRHSPDLGVQQHGLAHGLLLNKFLLAADAEHCIPITGKRYVHQMLSAKIREAVWRVRELAPELEPSWLRTQDVGYGTVVEKLIQSFVTDEQLAVRSLDEIAGFKSANRDLFREFSVISRTLVSEIETLPTERGYDREVEELRDTSVWKEAQEVEYALRSTWSRVFKDDVRETARNLRPGELFMLGGAIGVGVLPMSLEGLTLASVVGAGMATASWTHSKFVEYAAEKRNARRHGLYYLMKFAG